MKGVGMVGSGLTVTLAVPDPDAEPFTAVAFTTKSVGTATDAGGE
jgi:hypothetical protein